MENRQWMKAGRWRKEGGVSEDDGRLGEGLRWREGSTNGGGWGD